MPCYRLTIFCFYALLYIGASSTQSVAIEDDIDTNMDRLGQKLTSHTIFSAPSHIQPPLHSLYSAFMGLLLSSNVRNEDNDQQDWMDMDGMQQARRFLELHCIAEYPYAFIDFPLFFV